MASLQVIKRCYVMIFSRYEQGKMSVKVKFGIKVNLHAFISASIIEPVREKMSEEAEGIYSSLTEKTQYSIFLFYENLSRKLNIHCSIDDET